jgi:hypothetical protein
MNDNQRVMTRVRAHVLDWWRVLPVVATAQGANAMPD